MTSERQPRFEIYKSRGLRQRYRWRLIAGNGEIVATGEAHVSAWDARRAARRVAELAAAAEVAL